MSACAMLSYNNITRPTWDAIKHAAAAYGLNGNDTGNASVDGFTVSWLYNETTKVLHIQCTASPFYIPCSAINARINDEIEACIKANNIEMASMVPLGQDRADA